MRNFSKFCIAKFRIHPNLYGILHSSLTESTLYSIVGPKPSSTVELYRYDNIPILSIKSSLKWNGVTRFSTFVFFSHQTMPPWGPDSQAFWILLRIRQNMIGSHTQNRAYSVNDMHEHLLLYIVLVVGWENPRTDMFLIFPIKAGLASRIVRRLCMRCHILHVVSLTPHAPCMQCQWHRIHRASVVNNTACIRMHFSLYCTIKPFRLWFSLFEVVVNDPAWIVHAVPMTLQAPCMRCYWHRMHIENFELLRKF
jgi:hypothetical protein